MKTNDTVAVQKKEFIKYFENLSFKYGCHRVWSDFIHISAYAISNPFDKRFFDEREKHYNEIISRYEEKEISNFVHMLACVISAYIENSEQDFLGSVFGDLRLNNEWNGQFFTPYNIGSMMSKIILEEQIETKPESEPITISDPCCGSGCLLIGAVNQAKKIGYNIEKDVVIYAQDIDNIAALMCYIQLSLIGCKAMVKIGDSLSDPLVIGDDMKNPNLWLTPVFLTTKII